jgi:hypothetical protein
MANDVTIQKPTGELLMQAADELSGGNLGKILKFQKGKYFIGDDEIAANTEMIAHVTQLARGWVKFKGKELVDRRIGKVIDGFVAPQREDLDDVDQTNWERNDRDEPRDPWVMQTYLPFEHPETGELLGFITGSAGGRGAIGTLVKTASANLHKGHPIIHLAVRAYKHTRYGRIENPDFPIVGWTGGGTGTVPPNEITAPTKHPAFDDAIPF